MKTQKLVLGALFAAMHVVLCFFSLNFGNMVITFSGLPAVIGGVLFGPLFGLSVGLMGSFINQIRSYGITLTTILWILPAGIKGLMVGAYAKKHNFRLTRKQLLFILIVSAFVVTTVNTASMYIDSKIYGYYSYAYVFSAVIPRYISGILTSVVYMVVTPEIVKYLGAAHVVPSRQ